MPQGPGQSHAEHPKGSRKYSEGVARAMESEGQKGRVALAWVLFAFLRVRLPLRVPSTKLGYHPRTSQLPKTDDSVHQLSNFRWAHVLWTRAGLLPRFLGQLCPLLAVTRPRNLHSPNPAALT